MFYQDGKTETLMLSTVNEVFSIVIRHQLPVTDYVKAGVEYLNTVDDSRI